MHSARANQIDNEQFDEISVFERNQFPELERDYSSFSEVCAEPNPRFNCHGMTFGGRRTGIFEAETLQQILDEDGYEEMPRDQVKPGDVIIYYGTDGDFEHSGIVVKPPNADNLQVPTVRSKWAKYRELIHLGNRCPYTFSNVKYFRLTK